MQSIIDEIGAYDFELMQIVSDQESLHQQALANPLVDSRMTFITDLGVSDRSAMSLFFKSRIGAIPANLSPEVWGVARLVRDRYAGDPFRIYLTERVLWQQTSEALTCLRGLAAALDSRKNVELRVLQDATIAENREGLGAVEGTSFLVPHSLQTFYAGPNNPISRRWEADEVVAAVDRQAFLPNQSRYMLDMHLHRTAVTGQPANAGN